MVAPDSATRQEAHGRRRKVRAAKCITPGRSTTMTEQPEERPIGKIIHYFGKIGVGIIELSGTLKVGDTIRIRGAHTDFTQTVGSMQVEHEDVQEAAAGKVVGSAEWSVRRPLVVRCAALTDEQVSRLLARTERDKQARVISAPRLIVPDGRATHISVGREVPYVADYAVKAGEGGKTTYAPIVKYAFQGIELALRVTRSADRKYFVLAAEPTVSKVVGSSQARYVAPDGTATSLKVHVPEIKTAQARTTASVADGVTLALRGLPSFIHDPKPARRGEEMVLLVKPSEVRPGEEKRTAP